MKLNFKKSGQGRPLIILHGLFGMLDNWSTMTKAFEEQGFMVYNVDQRNHGRSPHSYDFNYRIMADDLLELMNDEGLEKADLIGHSMGAKTVMFFSLMNPARVNKMIAVDMAPGYYAPHHQSVFAALHSVEVEKIKTRKEAEEKLRETLREESTIQFLLKNIYWIDDKNLRWRFGLAEIEKNIEEIGKAFPSDKTVNVQALFIRGERSGYINADDERDIKKIFPNSEVKTVMNAGHWVHAENPKGFLDASLDFLTR